MGPTWAFLWIFCVCVQKGNYWLITVFFIRFAYFLIFVKVNDIEKIKLTDIGEPLIVTIC